MTQGVLFLVPVPLGDVDPATVLSSHILATVRGLDAFIVEEPKTARAFLKRAGVEQPLTQVRMATLNEHTSSSELHSLLAPLLSGQRVGLLSEAGYPAIADPGANLIARAHEQGVRVVPLAGPSSLLMALAASGLNGQRFACHGYLPVAASARAAAIAELESRSKKEGSAQLFIEVPYRNNQLLAALLSVCDEHTQLCLATELTLAGETIHTRSIRTWRMEPPELNRRPTVFVLQARTALPSAEGMWNARAGALRPPRLRSGARTARRYSRGE